MLKNMVQKIISSDRQRIDNVFKEIIMVGADVEADVFEPGKE